MFCPSFTFFFLRYVILSNFVTLFQYKISGSLQIASIVFISFKMVKSIFLQLYKFPPSLNIQIIVSCFSFRSINLFAMLILFSKPHFPFFFSIFLFFVFFSIFWIFCCHCLVTLDRKQRWNKKIREGKTSHSWWFSCGMKTWIVRGMERRQTFPLRSPRRLFFIHARNTTNYAGWCRPN